MHSLPTILTTLHLPARTAAIYTHISIPNRGTSLHLPAGTAAICTHISIPDGGASLQATIVLLPTADAEGADEAITSSEDIGGALLLAAAEVGLSVSAPTIDVILSCGDGLCSPGEPQQQGVEDTDITCPADCFVVIGECPAPTSSGVGDATAECGGNGLCNAATLTCDCFPGYAGDDCGYCSAGFGRNEQQCEPDVSGLVDGDAPAEGPLATIPPDEEDDDDDVRTILCLTITYASLFWDECISRSCLLSRGRRQCRGECKGEHE